MRWQTVLGNTGIFLTHFAVIPAYRVSAEEVILIDSGAQAHPELPAELDRLGLRAAAVLCTHLHPDHIANNRDLIDRYGTEIYASTAEIRDVGPRFALLRSDPLEEKWLWTQPDYPITAIGAERALEICGARFELLPTPGHVEGHLSPVTPDGVCCMGDAILSEEQLRASLLPFMEYDVDLAVESMAALGRTAYPLYIAAHRAVISPEELPALAEANIRKELELYDLLRKLLRKPVELEEAITAFMTAAGVGREIMLRRTSMRASARTRFAALARSGEIRIENGMVYPNR